MGGAAYAGRTGDEKKKDIRPAVLTKEKVPNAVRVMWITLEDHLLQRGRKVV